MIWSCERFRLLVTLNRPARRAVRPDGTREPSMLVCAETPVQRSEVERSDQLRVTVASGSGLVTYTHWDACEDVFQLKV